MLVTERYVFGLWGVCDKVSFSMVPNRPIWVWVIVIMTTSREKPKKSDRTLLSVTLTNKKCHIDKPWVQPRALQFEASTYWPEFRYSHQVYISLFTSEVLVDKHETKTLRKTVGHTCNITISITVRRYAIISIHTLYNCTNTGWRTSC